MAPFGWIAVGSHNQHSLKANLAHTLCQTLDTVLAEGLAGLIRAVLDQFIRHLLDPLARLRLAIDHLVDSSTRIGLAAPADPRATISAHRWSSRKVRTCSAVRRYSWAIAEL